ncbi:MAG: sigma-54 dependent transcriptional regulator, partial [Gammaproteobacteria bacterium]|nr:sigma-54 dependent transcriptional regulator [Gammaproteobacteria bacterium]
KLRHSKLENKGLKGINQALASELNAKETFLVGESPVMKQLYSMVKKVAVTDADVLILGENGTGKEVIAREIHRHSPRMNEIMVHVDMGAISESLFESELFGHVKGSFTGANQDRAGLFQTANGGTLFLDEVADLPLDMQVKLLRAIQEKSIRPVGASKEIPIDIRILSATHQDLTTLVKEGAFREDLFFRINVIELPIPSLRDHPDDIPLLVNHITARICNSMGLPIHNITTEALALLCNHPFPGNVRELENILERAITLSEDNTITIDDLRLTQSKLSSRPTTENSLLPEEIGLENYLTDIEKRILSESLEKNRFNKTATAKALKISFRSLRYRLQRLGIE